MSLEHGESGKSPEKSKSRKVLYGALATVAGAAVVVGSAFGIESALSQPDKRPTATASADPSKTPDAVSSPKPKAETLTVQSVEIPTGLTPEQLGTTLVSRLSDWDMAGATAANRKAYFATAMNGQPSDIYAQQLADKNGAIYADGLFGPNWESAPGISTYVPNEEKANDDTVQLWFSTSAGTDARDIQPFRTWLQAGTPTVVAETATTVSETIPVTRYNNAAQNRADELAPGTAALNGEQFVVDATFTDVGDTEQVSSFDIVAP